MWLDAQGLFVLTALLEYAISHQLNYQDKLQKQIKQWREMKREKKKTDEETKPTDVSNKEV